MGDIKEPYEECHPGQAITAELCNDLQIKIRNDIADRVEGVQGALDEHMEAPVDAATFGGKSVEEWKAILDEHYAHQDHEHDGVRRYRRYFMEMETVVGGQLQPAVIKHGMGRHPVVQVYQLVTLPIHRATNLPILEKAFKMCFCGPPHHNDPEAREFKTKSWDERHWGDEIDDKMIDDLAHELDPAKREAFKAKFKDDFTLNVWLSNLEEALFEPGPGQYHFDMGDVHRTQWVRNRETNSVKELKQKGEWPARFVYRPRLIIDQYWTGGDDPYRDLLVEIFHLNLNEIEIAPQTDEEMHFMVLLRS
jgi:hypothetical protein